MSSSRSCAKRKWYWGMGAGRRDRQERRRSPHDSRCKERSASTCGQGPRRNGCRHLPDSCHTSFSKPIGKHGAPRGRERKGYYMGLMRTCPGRGPRGWTDWRRGRSISCPTWRYFAAPKPGRQDLLDAIDRHLTQMKKNPSSIYYRSLQCWTSEEARFRLSTWIKAVGITVAALPSSRRHGVMRSRRTGS